MEKMFPFVVVGVIAGLLIGAIMNSPSRNPRADGLARVRELAQK